MHLFNFLFTMKKMIDKFDRLSLLFLSFGSMLLILSCVIGIIFGAFFISVVIFNNLFFTLL